MAIDAGLLLSSIEGSDLFLFLVLVMLFVVGYKILQAVVRLALVAVMSGTYFIALNVLGIGPAISLDKVILFMILGTGLFIVYSTIATALSVGGGIVGFMTKHVTHTPKKKLREELMRRREKHSSKEKDIILHELNDD